MLLNENVADTFLIQEIAKPIKVFTRNDFPELNYEFTKLLNKLLLDRHIRLLNKTRYDIQKSIDILIFLGKKVPIKTTKVKVLPMLFSLETNSYSIPILFFVDIDYNKIISGHIVVDDNRNNRIIKTLGINKSYSKGIINDIVRAIKKCI